MSIISKPINLSTEGTILYEILKKLDILIKVVADGPVPTTTTTTTQS